MKNKFRLFFQVSLFLCTQILLFSRLGQTSNVLLVKSIRDAAHDSQLTEIACRFYGLKLRTITVDKDSPVNPDDFISENLPDCIILLAQTLPFLSQEPYYSLIHPQNSTKRRILILGVTPELDMRWLRKWSGGLIDSCQTRELSRNSFYQIADSREIARELAGQIFPTNHNRYPTLENGLMPGPNEIISPLVAIVDNARNFELAQFVQIQKTERVLFVKVGQKQDPIQAFKGNWRYQPERFFKITPILMFLRYSLGEKCWHAIGDYANLTIDDPWLIEPYGFLSFPKLLQQMEEAHFHTTIAFIPWNFDRSHADVVSLLQQHPDKFSICVHGNNHDHREFWKYQGQSIIPGQVKSIQLHEQNIRQALVRMQEFSQLTGLDYDRVMVFPHAIAPAPTLGMLKKYHFLATFNSGNVPIGARPPDDPVLQLRSMVIEYENLPSYHRFEPSSQDIAKNQFKIAIDLFLDNPVLLFSHHNLFQSGIDAFNRTASYVNYIQPQVRWLSLADIARQAYLVRKVNENNYDVLAFSREFILVNQYDSTIHFRVRKPENFCPPIQSLTVDGIPQAFDSLDSQIAFSLVLKPGEEKKVVVESFRAPAMDSVWLGKNTRYQHLLRRISDFRDLTLTANGLGRRIDQFYTRTGLVRIGPFGTVAIIFLANLFLLVTAVQLRIRKSMNSVRRNSEKLIQSN